MEVNGFVWWSVLLVSFGAFVTGFITGGMNGALEMEGFKATFNDLYNVSKVCDLSSSTSTAVNSSDAGCGSSNGAGSDSMIGFFVSIANLAAGVSSFIAGWMSDKFSRKYGIFIGGVTMLIGSAIISSSFYVWMLIIGRLLVGAATGEMDMRIFYVITPIYVSEMSPKEHRGMLSALTGPMYTLGLLAVLAMNIGLARFCEGWRVGFALVALMALVFSVGMWLAPHTPRWLLKVKRDMEALEVLARINRHNCKETFVDTYLELKELQAVLTADSNLRKELFQFKYRWCLSIILFFLAGICGIFILYYSSSIFCEVGIQPFYGSLAVGIVLTATVTTTFLIDKLGRTIILLSACVMLSVLGLIIGILAHLDYLQSDIVKYSVVVLSCGFGFVYISSWIVVPWVVACEILPLNVRVFTVSGLSRETLWHRGRGYSVAKCGSTTMFSGIMAQRVV